METEDLNLMSILSENDLRATVLSEEDTGNIQSRLWTLLGKQIARFTMGDSSSVTVETAQELYKSICFTIGMLLKSSKDGLTLLMKEDMDALLRSGWIKIEEKMRAGRDFLKKAEAGAVQVGNISYNDTLKELGGFFKKYDYRLYAHDIPCSIDYQLCHAVPEELLGIDYINEYLGRLVIENELCTKFDIEKVIALLTNYCPDYKGLLINLYDAVITNAVGLAMLNGDVYSLDITDGDRWRLLRDFSEWSKEEALQNLRLAAGRLCDNIKISDNTAVDYAKNTAVALYPRIEASMNSGELGGIFLSLSSQEPEVWKGMEFIDNAAMDDEALRTLIDEIQSCRYLSDKISMVKRHIHSMRDFSEVLNICFWGSDCNALFRSLDRAELAPLLNFTAEKAENDPDWHSESGWERLLASFIQKQGLS